MYYLILCPVSVINERLDLGLFQRSRTETIRIRDTDGGALVTTQKPICSVRNEQPSKSHHFLPSKFYQVR